MLEVQIEEMMEAGAHFGHQTKRWNPKMRPYLYGVRSGVHIIDLQKTKSLAQEAFEFVVKNVAQGRDILFVGTKPQARETIKVQAERCKMFYVTDRWMGGTLTNFKTIKKSIDRLIELETRREKNDFEGYTKKELLDIDRTIIKLQASLGGIKLLKSVPGLIFVVDPKQEHIAVLEAKKLGIPIVALTDSNCNPDPIDYVIPGNDDAISSVDYFAAKVAEACLLGLSKRESSAQNVNYDSEGRPSRGPKRGDRRSVKGSENTKTYVSRAVKDQTFEGDAAGGFSATVEAAPVETAATSEKPAASE